MKRLDNGCSRNAVRKVIFSLFLMLLSSTAQAGRFCRYVHSQGDVIFDLILSQSSQAQRRNLREWHLAHFFYDRKDMVTNVAMGTPAPAKFRERGEDSFLGYMFARNEITKKPWQEVFTVEGLTQIQKDTLMSHRGENTRREFGIVSTKNSEGTSSTELGQLRKTGVVAKVSDPNRSPNPEILTHSVELKGRSPRTWRELERENSYLKYIGGYVEYARIQNWRSVRSQLSEKMISALEKEETRKQPFDPARETVLNLRQKYISELVEFELNQFRKVLGDSTKSKEQLLEAIAKMHWKILSIHPFFNGNGRTVRLLTERALQEMGLPSPIWTHFEQDVYRSLEEFTQILKDSVRLSQYFQEKVKGEVRRGAPISNLKKYDDQLLRWSDDYPRD